MRHLWRGVLAAATLVGFATIGTAAVPPGANVLEYHGDGARSGNYVVPGLTDQAAQSVRRDPGFDGRVDGHVYAQPLYWRAPGAAHGLLIVATENDVVDALDATTGRLVWRKVLGSPMPRPELPCGDIDPLGITGTPVIDAGNGALYLDAMVRTQSGPEHLVFGLRLSDGAVLPGWPVNVREALASRGVRFIPDVQNQRAALALLDGRVLVGFSGHFGDCGDYHGIVLSVATAATQTASGWATRGDKGGIWAPGGITLADGSAFFTTGNTVGATQWADGEGVFRVGPTVARSSDPRDYYAPANWKALDDADLDMSGVSPLPIDLPDGARRIVALGKDGDAYLLDRENLGGIGGQIAVVRVAGTRIITGPAVYPGNGGDLVAFQSQRVLCPNGRNVAGIGALAITARTIRPAWCASLDGRGAPIVTTTDGHSNPIVWVMGAEGDDRLHAYRGDTGQALLTGADRIDGLRHFATMLVAEGRLYAAADGRVSAFGWRR